MTVVALNIPYVKLLSMKNRSHIVLLVLSLAAGLWSCGPKPDPAPNGDGPAPKDKLPHPESYPRFAIQNTRAGLWITAKKAEGWLSTPAISESLESRVAQLEQVTRVEAYLHGEAVWKKDEKAKGLKCFVVSARVDAESLGLVESIPPAARLKLSEPDTVVFVGSDDAKPAPGKGDATTEINGYRVRVVATLAGEKEESVPYVFCSLQTAGHVLNRPKGEVTFVLAECRPDQAEAVAKRVGALDQGLVAYTRAELLRKTREQWLAQQQGKQEE